MQCSNVQHCYATPAPAYVLTRQRIALQRQQLESAADEGVASEEARRERIGACLQPSNVLLLSCFEPLALHRIARCASRSGTAPLASTTSPVGRTTVAQVANVCASVYMVC